MSSFFSRRAAATAACTTLILAPASAAPAFAVDTAAQSTTISVLSFNDFHGALSENYIGTQFADTVEDYRRAFEAQHGEGSVLLTSAGDLIGGSASVSNVQQDLPTIDIMNALDLAVLGAGNHEFDRGLDDLTGRVAERANFPVVAANFVDPQTKEPVLSSHEIFEVNGVRVAVIGAVPNNLYATTTAAGLQGNEVLDLVQAVNAVADELKATDQADVVVASYHDGARGAGDFSAEQINSEVFRSIVQDTTASVDVIFNGHTHQLYHYGAAQGGVDRPVMQAGQSGSHVAAVELTLNAEGELTGVDSQMLARSTQDPAAAAAESPRTAEVYRIEQEAVAYFKEAQSTVIANLDGSLTTDYADVIAAGGNWRAGGSRSAESTLGNWSAEAIKRAVETADQEVDIAVNNPGGLRSELLYDRFTASGAFTDKPAGLVGKLTLGEVLDVAPFGNTLVYFDIPGSSIKTTLEENWRGDTRRFTLGWSENFTWTYDASRAEGDRVTGIWIDGQPVQDDQMYTVATLSFLGDDTWVSQNNPANAPDGYTGLAIGRENFVNLGLRDAQALTDQARAEAEAEGAVRPDFAKKGVSVTGAPATVSVGAPIALTLGDLQIRSDGSPAVSSVDVAFAADGTVQELGSVSAVEPDTVTLTGIQAPQQAGDGELVMTVHYTDGTTTIVRHALTVTGAPVCDAPNFSDNAPGTAYFSAIRWMQCAGISTGYTDGRFGKAERTKRGESMSFLYRYMGDQDAAYPAPAFPDVPATSAHVGAIAWGVAEEITRGYANGTFGLSRDVTRGEFASFLFRAAGPEYTAPATSDFSDVRAGSTHYDAIQWMASVGVTNGYVDGTFRPNQQISRGELAVLMHRFEALVAAQD
ncbi:MAG: S-layer homology domain-containing protein [Micrococcus sp.]|nr:S-layer homology domain-containing protein [Micrococcus sp.]